MPRPAARRSSALAPTPPATTRRVEAGLRRSARIDFFTSTSTIAACVAAARSATVLLADVRAELRSCVITAVFRPANEKSRLPLCSSGRGSVESVGVAELGQPRQRGPARIAEPHAAWPTCRTPRRRRRRSSRRAARSARRRRPASAACARPTPAARRRETRADRPTGTATAGGLRGGARPSTGRASAAASAQATPAPTSSAPARPGPARVGDDVELARATRQPRASTWRASGSTRRMWSREASSGTTPP